MGANYDRKLHCFAVFAALSTFCLILAGALVTSNDAGLAVPDWPLSFGQLMPDMVGGVFYEHGHRMIASGVGILTIILALWLSRSEPRRWVRRLGWLALAVVILQGLLGGVTVLFLLPPAVSVLHACLAQTFFCLLVSIAVVTGRSWVDKDQSHEWLGGSLEFSLAAVAAGAIYVQLIAGAILRHSGAVEGVKGASIVLGTLIAHLTGALLVTAAVLSLSLAAARATKAQTWIRLAYLLAGLLIVQLGLGVGAFLVRLQIPGRFQPLPLHVIVTTAHLAVGAVMLAVALILTLRLGQCKRMRQDKPFAPRLAGEHP